MLLFQTWSGTGGRRALNFNITRLLKGKQDHETYVNEIQPGVSFP
jgi:hypothetical protein